MKNRLFPFQGWRLTLFQAVVFAVFLLFSVRMYELQIVDYDEFNDQANQNRLSSLPIAASRGAIRDRNDVRLAFNVPAYNVTIIPADIPDTVEEEFAVYNRLSALVNVPPTRAIADQSGSNLRSIEELVAEGEGIAPFRPVIIAQDIDRRVMMQILEERIFMPGVDIEVVGVREYPLGSSNQTPSLSHIIGYLGPIPPEDAVELREQGYNPAFDRIGYEGIERYLETLLGGVRGTRLREVDVAGEELGIISETSSTPGQSVRLTIDAELQEAAEELLQEAMDNRNNPAYYQERGQTLPRGLSTQGVVIAMNPNTGEVLALVSLPTYDNERFARAIDVPYYLDIADDPARPLVNNAIKGLYPPGSVWKLLTAAAVAEEEVIAPDIQLLAEGQLILENRYAPNDPAASQRFVCWLREGHGLVNLVQGIAWSCDVYFYQVGGGNPSINPAILRPGGLGVVDLFRYATATGIGSELGIELPFENAGRMPDEDWKRRNLGENWSTGDTYNAAFGQGYVTVTPLQLVTQVAAIVNGGTLYQPTIIREFFDQEGNIIEPFQPQILRTINPELVADDEPMTLLLLEDMLMNGQASLACTCEENSPWWDPFRCDPDGYRNVVNVSDDPFTPVWREYRVHIPLNYSFNGSVCQPLRFTPATNPYQPAFIQSEALRLTREGMRAAVTIEGGTSGTAALDDMGIAVAGKTGTAEYCDDVARPLGYCVPGQWPSHAWYVGYAPYENPEIVIVAFVYNGDEGSFTALPLVRETMRRYFELQAERGLRSSNPTTDSTSGG
ncbi:MAG: penicillin-binding transpeptidase domain-containing protein [Anaerolineae bacterium]|nr:penicillin-binding transpeptidase domain-containing protein [Anaerolineae bacterium]